MEHALLPNSVLWFLAALAGLGVFHGINPGMGWLFAVALGMQEQSEKAVWRAIGPLAAGHGLAIAAAIALAAVFETVIPWQMLKLPLALALIAFGLYRLFRHWHPRYGGMRVGTRDLAIWSFLMATAHGAGLMVLPLFLRAEQALPQAHAGMHASMAMAAGPQLGLAAVVVHGAGYLAATALLAWVVYKKVGVGMLRRAWVNLDGMWAVALMITGLLTLVI
jgi:hypothetical protein